MNQTIQATSKCIALIPTTLRLSTQTTVIARIMDSSKLFSEVSHTVGKVFQHVFQIFSAHFKPLLLISLIYNAVLSVVIFVLGIISVISVAAYFLPLLAYVANNVANNANRNLLDHSLGVSGSSRLLHRTEDYSGLLDLDDIEFPEFGAKFIVIMVCLCIVWVLALTLVSSIFTGAFCHAIAEIYIGATPSPDRSIKRGMSKAWNLFKYQFAICSTFLGYVILIVALVVKAFELMMAEVDVDDDSQANKAMAELAVPFLCLTAFYILLAVFAPYLTAVVPAIVIESKSPIEAIKRSWFLCKGFHCFIIGNICCFNIAAIIVSSISNVIADELEIFGLVVHFLVQISVTAFTGV